jgi:hypothetical protein
VDDELAKARLRLEDLTAKTAAREAALGREAFLEMPPSLKSQLSVLQAQSEPKADTLEAIVAAEHNLREYNDRLDEAFNLRNQVAGERGRRATARKRQATRTAIWLVVGGGLVGAAVVLYKSGASAKGEECRALPACAEEGLCGARLEFKPFGFVCAAQGEDCSKSRACSERGLCSSREGICMALASEDCRRARRCSENGLCTEHQGTCIAGGDPDCRASRACHEAGACLEMQGQCITPPSFSASAAAKASAAPSSSLGPRKPLPQRRP